jgi:hypothetical protein
VPARHLLVEVRPRPEPASLLELGGDARLGSHEPSAGLEARAIVIVEAELGKAAPQVRRVQQLVRDAVLSGDVDRGGEEIGGAVRRVARAG